MNSTFRKLIPMSQKRFSFPSFLFSPPVFLFLLALLAYAPFFWERGFYWDEAPWTWIYYRLGPDALTRTFSTSRPFWGLIYQLMLPLIGPHPWAWQLLVIPLRWLTAVLVWVLIRQLWPGQSRLALWTGALFLVYPGLGQNFIALMYTHFYIVLCAFLGSLICSVVAVRRKDWRWHLPALFLCLVNLLTMEYFYFLEFIRPVFFFLLFSESLDWKAAAKKISAFWPPVRQSLQHAWPYVFLFVGVTVWRAFFFTNQNASYTYQTLADLRANFFYGVGILLQNIGLAFWESVPHAWLFSFEPVDPPTLGWGATILAFSLALAATLLTGLYFRRQAALEQGNPAQAFSPLSPFLVGLLAWFLSGGAYWLVGARTLPQLHFSADRFTLSFMFGSCLMLAALLSWLGARPRLQHVLLALLIGFAVGRHFQTNLIYRRDWATQRTFFWQMSWRAPSLQPGVTLLTNDLPVTVFSDNSLSGPLNWIYNAGLLSDPRAFDPGMNYILYFASVRVQENRALGEKLLPSQSFEQNYLARVFHGNTSKMIVAHFEPPGCFRILDPEIDPLNTLIPPVLRDAAPLSNPAMVLDTPAARLPDFYQPEPAHNWCYYFSQAELARQLGDWKQVNRLAKQAFALDDHPNDPLENFVFIEGYARAGEWKQALALTEKAYNFSKQTMRPMLCKLWERISRTASDSTEAVSAAQAALKCK